MNEKLRAYIDAQFQDAPATRAAVELKEEILQNLTDKYNDLLAEGKNEEAAFNIAIASVGDFSELIKELKKDPAMTKEQEEQYAAYKKRKALLTSIAIGLYILCALPIILLNNAVGVTLMFVLVAASTGVLIYIFMTKPDFAKNDPSMVEDFKAWRETSSDHRRAYKSISSALWCLVVVIYFVVSFATRAWHVTWIIFLVAAAINSVVRAVFDLKK
ncbi:MAG: permease prefix domain 1-containing protein [Clostridiales bacterium]|jgi:uncharacterized membrane protein|nr:permease prefix domain 1-containing protein [Clostridiales bacterium]